MPSIRVPARLENLESCKTYLRENLPARFADQWNNVQLVAEELLVNVFSYAYPEGDTGEAQINLETVPAPTTENGGAAGEWLVFTVRDWGEPFNPFEEVPDPDLTLDVEARPVGGLGIFLIKQVSARQDWAYEEGANTIHIYFRPTEAS